MVEKSSITHKSSKFDLDDLNWTNMIPECPVYHPSEQEFEHPLVYLQKIAPEASKYGICKIVSPISASNPAEFVLMKEKKDFKFETIVQPLRLSKWNEKDIITFSKRGRKFTYQEFEAIANKAFSNRFCSSEDLSSLDIEKAFWHEMIHGEKGTVEYGVNIEGSVFSCDPDDKLGTSKFNLKNLARLPQSPLRLVDRGIPGITDPMLYIGMLFSMFAWHVEDHYLYSINYHHSGGSKTWYGVPSSAASQFEKTVLNHVYCKKILAEHGENGAFQFLAQKTTMFPPNVLLQHDVPVYKAVQKPGEFVITFPNSYHAGFSHGFNCGEAVNFAIGDWFPFGAAASKRYAHLKILPIIPYEELVCKEAMLIYNSSKDRSYKSKLEVMASYCAIEQSFWHLMQYYKTSLSRLNNSRKSSSSSNTSIGSVTCSLCHRDCYVAYLLCKKCYSHPICLFHDVVPKTCLCGGKYTVFKTNDMSELEDAAKSFEQNDNRHEEKSARRTVNSARAVSSKLKTRLTDNVKHNVEKNQKKTKNRRRNNASPSVMSAKRPRTLYNLRKHESKLIIEAPAISSRFEI
ncbi:lysine-specific demethylase JMJ706 [Medicago truncatula]|uniref:Transcription factor jumonji family protein, putative n=2 Tax=Medicago truncatula TaxID=3880 RepID=G7IBD2_MEDTR|nr:lysine-specific demethylase JMJ706 [Medicago truncatula]AES59966.1 transcription factor jumonji family protein, putative [Medicago truncatula]